MATQRRPAGDWMCPNCNVLISKKSCRKCGAKNPSRGSKSHKTGKRGGSGRRGKKGGKFSHSGSEEWICSKCSSSNYPDRDQCRNCRTSRLDTTTSTASHKKEAPVAASDEIIDGCKQLKATLDECALEYDGTGIQKLQTEKMQ
eukprot:931551_1